MKYYHQNKTASEPRVRQKRKKNILVILVYLCSRPAQGGGAGLVKYYHQNKTAPEPRVRQKRKKNILVILVYLCSRPAQGGGAGLVKYYHQNKTAPEPPLPILLDSIMGIDYSARLFGIVFSDIRLKFLERHTYIYTLSTTDEVMCMRTRTPGGMAYCQTIEVSFNISSESRSGPYSPITYLMPLSYYFTASFVTVCYKLFPLCRL